MSRRTITIDDVVVAFPIGSPVSYRGSLIGHVIGYKENMPEPEVVYATTSGQEYQFSIRSVKFRRIIGVVCQTSIGGD
jgi:hypothetical protein